MANKSLKYQKYDLKAPAYEEEVDEEELSEAEED